MHTRVIGAFVFCGRKRQIFLEDIFLEEGRSNKSLERTGSYPQK